jgi:hypothetical protein
MKWIWILLVAIIPVLAYAQSSADPKAFVLANTHGRIHDVMSEMFNRDNSTLEQWAADPGRIPHADEMCTAGERTQLQILANNVRVLNTSPTEPNASTVLYIALRLEAYQPSTRAQLKKTLSAAFSASGKNAAGALTALDSPAPAQVEVSREDLMCHFIPNPGSAEPISAAGPTYEIVVGKDGKTKSAAPQKIQGEIGTWNMAVRAIRYRPFYFLGDSVEAKGLVTIKMVMPQAPIHRFP